MKEIIEQYFKDDKVKYFHPADLIADDHYLRYEWKVGKIILSIGCNEGEIPLFVCSEPGELEQRIKTIIYQ